MVTRAPSSSGSGSVTDSNNAVIVTVAYSAVNNHYKLIDVTVSADSTILAAIEQSGLLKQFPEINLQTQRVGIFSKLKNLSDGLRHGDRIEIYRSLLADPKDARRQRVDKARKDNKKGV